MDEYERGDMDGGQFKCELHGIANGIRKHATILLDSFKPDTLKSKSRYECKHKI
jgi:hypothetical protein